MTNPAKEQGRIAGRIADRIKGRVWQCYEAAVLGRPGVVLAALFALVAALASQAGDFRLDASADSLLLENDDDLRYYRSLVRRYGSDDFVAVTVTPGGDLFAPPALARLDALQNDLAALPGIRQVLSLLDVPLLDSPRISLSDLSKEKRTLRTPGVDTEMARREFRHSPLYRNLLLSDDGGTTMMLAYLETDDTLENLLAERERLRLLKQQRGLDAEQARQLAETSRLFRARQAEQVQQRRATIAAVRGVMDHHRERAELSLGGVPMIIADMIAMIENDLVVFGAAVAAFLVLMLTVIFRSPRWVALPMMCCLLSALAMVGLLGLLDWRVTVISSNFVALILIIAMSMTIHLTVRFRELQAARPAEEPRQLLKETVRFMFRPCIYTSLTTIVAFVSLLASGIRPVIDFGWLMTLGIVFAFFLIFTLFPSFLMVLKKGESRAENDFTTRLTGALARLTRRRHRAIAVVGLAAALASAFGIGQLEVENRFIDYFRDDTEIHRGMLLIDRKLGGTTPLDIVLKADAGTPSAPVAAPTADTGDSADNNADDDFALDDYLEDDAEQPPQNYWLNPRKLGEIQEIHDYLDAQAETGKVMSLATLARLAEMLKDGQPLDDFETALIGKLLPGDVKNILYTPYISADGNEVRFNARIIDSNKDLSRADFLNKIQSGIEDLGYDAERFRLTGMLVLYNNMLQSLYESQILTIGTVFLAILAMFTVLFRSWLLAAIAIFPNLLAAALVLGFMGYRGIPLDMMTITIAAISVGIAVDNTIHYIIRFKREFPKDRDYFAAIERCHGSIGKAVYYTSVTIIFGFSILALSNFIPTIYFGLLIGLAMLAALTASLTLLPSLLILFKPLGAPGAPDAPGAPEAWR